MKLITLFFDDWKKIDQLTGKPYLMHFQKIYSSYLEGCKRYLEQFFLQKDKNLVLTDRNYEVV